MTRFRLPTPGPIAAALLLVLSLPLPAAPAAADTIPIAREHVVVEATQIRLGDLFMNAGASATIPVAAAPVPGERSTFDARALGEIAAAHALGWRPSSRYDRVVVERASRILGAGRIEDIVTREIAARTPGRSWDIELDNRQIQMHLSAGAAHAARIDDLQIDQRNGRFSALMVAPDGRRVEVSGRLLATVEIPVLRDPVMPGEAIGERHLDWQRLRSDRLARGIVTDAGWLVGRTPRRPITPGTPIRLNDIQDRVVIPKGALVTMIYQSPLMTLTSRGRALENGYDGGAVRILNTQSNQTVEGKVAGPDLVLVEPLARLAAYGAAGTGFAKGANR